MIETRLLQQFVAVAEELHFNRAAERLHMAQPPLSQAIRKLESAVGAPLFVRTNRSVALTPAGVAFLVTARSTLRALEEGMAQTRRVAEGIEGHLTLTFINIAPYAALLRALRGFRHASPGISFTMVEATTQEQVIALEEGRADMGSCGHRNVCPAPAPGHRIQRTDCRRAACRPSAGSGPDHRAGAAQGRRVRRLTADARQGVP